MLAGEFKGPRPAWDAVGAEFVDDVVPHETRKLWLLNGAHSLMAYAATIVGHATVADAIADPIVRGWVDEWWDVTQRHLELPDDVIADYRAALLQRFSNPRMKDQLSRIAADGSQAPDPDRAGPVGRPEGGQQSPRRRAGGGRLDAAPAGQGAPFNDARSDKIAHLSDGSLEDSVDKVCEFLEIDDRDSKASILTLARQLGAEMGHAPAGSRVVIGLDVGTTAAKVSAFALGGGWRTGAGHEYPLQQPRPGWEVQDPEVMWRALHEGLADVASELGDAQVVGIGVSTAMHGLLALDAERRPITPLLTWADSRAAEQAMRLRDTDQGRRLHRTSGTPIHSMSHLCKLLWYAENDPDTVAAARWWVGLKDYILLQLTGELVTDLSNASGTGLLDSRAEDWNPEALELVGVRRDQLPLCGRPPTCCGCGTTWPAW